MSSYDVIIVGAGPAGSTSALLLARQGFRVVMLEKSRFPRFHIGESILPQNFPLVQELGLEAELERLPHLKKYGAEFGMGDDHDTTRFNFDSALIPGSRTFNIERAHFDKMLMDAARAAGAEVREQTGVKRIVKLADRDVAVQLDTGEQLDGKYLLDASGHGTVVGRHLGLRKPVDDVRLHKVAYFNHFDGVERPPGAETGHPTIIMADEGWFWLIGLTETRTSVGFVCHPDLVKRVGVPANRMLQWAASRCPVVRHRMRDATGPATNEVLADFSYTCKPNAGAGYFMVGDAGCFLDPIFSTGVTLAMKGAQQAARHVAALLRNETSPAAARSEYVSFINGSTGVFWHLIRNYYTHSFRELFLNGTGPLNVHGAIISILAGHVFPRPPFQLRWRLWLFDLCRAVNSYVPLVRRRNRFSLIAEPPQELPKIAGSGAPQHHQQVAAA
ncbi:MAG TPA: NAD(P)/FAD-dependent oxidoreductase [Tepidisphaeraceae bacterium]|nr:NAD(P)/FAD-dependent oxidoreductase [Tepidisphaeraceae bacterium]